MSLYIQGTMPLIGLIFQLENKVLLEYKPVYIGDDCWIGRRVIILPGVKIGKGCIIGAGAVVTKSFPDYSIIAGNPAVIKKYRMRN